MVQSPWAPKPSAVVSPIVSVMQGSSPYRTKIFNLRENIEGSMVAENIQRHQIVVCSFVSIKLQERSPKWDEWLVFPVTEPLDYVLAVIFSAMTRSVTPPLASGARPS